MSQVSAFHCPNCGGPLDAPNTNASSMRCPFCGTSVLIPENLRQRSSTAVAQPSEASVEVSRSAARSIGCLIAGIFLFIAVSTLIPLLFAGAAISQIPGISAIPGLGGSKYARQVLSFGGEGIGPGLFQAPRAVTQDGEGAFYVADWEEGRIQRLDAEGKFLSQWIVPGKNVYIDSMVALADGTVYVLSEGNIHKYNGKNGELQQQINFQDHGLGYANKIVAGADGNLYLAADTDNILRLTPQGELSLIVEEAIQTQTGDTPMVVYLAMDGLGNFYLVSTRDKAVFKFDPTGKYLNRFGSEGDKPGQFIAPLAITVDGQGRIYISDAGEIKIYENDGLYVGSIPTGSGVAYGLTYVPPNRLIAVTYGHKVQVYELK